MIATADLPDIVRELADFDDESNIPREQLSVLEFSRQLVYLAEGPRFAGFAVRFDVNWFPLQLAMLEAFDDKRWSEFVIVGPPQSGKTMTAIVLPVLHRMFELGQSAFYMHANEKKAAKFWESKLLKTILASPELKRFVPEDRDDAGRQSTRHFTNGCDFEFAGSESAAALSMTTAQVVICDDVQDTKPAVRQRGHGASRGHACELALRRAASFSPETRTIINVGTAGTTDDYHWKKLLASSYFVPYLPCPDCGTYQWLDFDRMVYDESDPLGTAGTYMRCANDGGRIDGGIGSIAEGQAHPDDDSPESIRPVHGGLGKSGLPGGLRFQAASGTIQSDGMLQPAGSFADASRIVCPYKITHRDLPVMLPRVRWVSVAGLDVKPGMIDDADGPGAVENKVYDYPASRIPSRVCGFWFNSLYWPNSDWAQIAAEWQAAKGNPDAEASFRQNQLCIPASPPKAAEEIDASTFTALTDPAHRWGTIPIEADCHGTGGVLLITVDPGSGFVWYQVHAWRISDGRSWLVELGIAGEKPDLRTIAKEKREQIYSAATLAALRGLNARVIEGWEVAGTGEIVRPTAGYVDRGYLAEAVDAFVGEFDGWLAVFGSVQRKAPLWPEQPAIKDGAVFWEANTNRAKFEYRGRIVPGSPDAITLPGDMPDPFPTLLREHMAGEFWDEPNGKWKRTGANHYFDTGALQIVAARHNGVRIMSVTEATPQQNTTAARESQSIPQEATRWTRDGLPFLATQRGGGGWR